MRRFCAVFVRMKGVVETHAANGYALSAETLENAEDEALKLPVPLGANFVKITDAGHVVRLLELSL